jgi:DNA-binding transcriptional LysR family regulator
MDIQDLQIFARVAAVQNLSAVGVELGLTPGTISKRLQALEDHLRVRLFDRTTRSIRITDEGRTFLNHVKRVLSELEHARAAIGLSVERPQGRLKVSAPASLGRRFVAPAICSFMRAYPEIEVQIDLSDRIVNLQEEGYDVAVRTGALPDSTLIAKRLAPDRQVIVAAPAYIAGHGNPAAPADIAGHDCLVLGDTATWTFAGGGAEHAVKAQGRLRSNNGELLRHAALDGLGLFRTSEFRVRDDIADGGLVQVLPDWEVTANSAIWAVYPSNKHVLPKLRVLLDHLADWFRDHRGSLAGESRPQAAVAIPPAAVQPGERAVTQLRA